MMAVVRTAVGESDCTPHLHQFCDVVGGDKTHAVQDADRRTAGSPQDIYRYLFICCHDAHIMSSTS